MKKFDITNINPLERQPLGRCGKVMMDKKGAQTKRNHLISKGRVKDLRIYPCDRCHGAWHLTKDI